MRDLRELTPAQRLIVSADFKPSAGDGREWVRSKVLGLALDLEGTGVVLKVNSALRACGYGLIMEIRDHGLEVFADTKLYDTKKTLEYDALLLNECEPELLTVGPCGVPAMTALRAALSEKTELLAVTALTTFSTDDSYAMFACSTIEAVIRLGRMAERAKVNGFISSGREAGMLQEKFSMLMSINTPAIRPTWHIVEDDDQNPERSMTPGDAISAGATRVVVGRPITQSSSRREATLRTIEEIAKVVG